jgi:hypothetical protein
LSAQAAWTVEAVEASEGSFLLTTARADAVGTPKLRMAFIFHRIRLFLRLAINLIAGRPFNVGNVDFSMGVIGTAASPEPGTAILCAGAMFILGLAVCAKRR